MTKRDSTPAFSIGIEEEYLLVDPESGDLRNAPESLLADLKETLGEQVSTEFLSCQIEVGTKVCATLDEAQHDLGRLRRIVAEHAGGHGLAPIAASCHPWADWAAQDRTDKARYAKLDSDLGAVARRMLIGGMHVHVGIDDRDTRIAVMNRLADYLPLLLALSASSPFWQGEDTGLASWRVSVFDGMPRTGPPPRFVDWDDFKAVTDTLVELEIIEDTSKIWWDLRPSHAFPTIETRICDVAPRLEDTLMLAGLIQALARMIWRTLDADTAPQPAPMIALENRWRAQRYGVKASLIAGDPASLIAIEDYLEDTLQQIAPDLDSLGSAVVADQARAVVRRGNSASRQRAIYQGELDSGQSERAALHAIIDALVAEFAPQTGDKKPAQPEG